MLNRQKLSGELLNEVYESVRSEVKQLVSSTEYVNFTLDESTAINHDRIANLSLITGDGQGFYLTNDYTGSMDYTVVNLTALFKSQIDRVSSCESPRVNSLYTDICSTIRQLQKVLARDSQFKHTFFVGCDSYGLQLLIKDIFGSTSIPYYRDVLYKITKVSNILRRSKKVQVKVKEIVLATRLDIKALTFATVTRQGSYYIVANALLANRLVFLQARRDLLLFVNVNG